MNLSQIFWWLLLRLKIYVRSLQKFSGEILQQFLLKQIRVSNLLQKFLKEYYQQFLWKFLREIFLKVFCSFIWDFGQLLLCMVFRNFANSSLGTSSYTFQGYWFGNFFQNSFSKKWEQNSNLFENFNFLFLVVAMCRASKYFN